MLVDVPVVKVDNVELEVEDLDVQVAVFAKVRKLLNLSVGAQAHLDKVELQIEGVEARRCSRRGSTTCRRSSIASL